MMGKAALSMTMSSKVKLDARSSGDPGHVFILIPLVVPVSVQFLTCIPVTGSSFFSFPRLPMLRKITNIHSHRFHPFHLVIFTLWVWLSIYTNLIPWPGPQKTFETKRFLLPSPMETQSSPTPMNESTTWTPVDELM